jgi:hypothetical protein
MSSATAPRDLRTLAKAPNKEQLIAALEGAGQEPLSLTGARGETVLVLPHGGRVLGAYSAASGKNFLWTSAAISIADLAREHFASDRWCNSGGDRTWLAPEIDLFYPHFPDTGRQYFQPREFDPGRYDADRSSSHIALSNALKIHSFRRGWTVPARIIKTIRTTTDPLSLGSTKQLSEELEFAGYRLETSLELFESGGERCQVSLWNLLQLPGGGEMIVPLYGPTKPVTYFGDIPAGALSSDERCVRYRMSASGEQKIGVDALAAVGRAGYDFVDTDDPGIASLVVRSFAVDARGPYVDVPLHSPESGGHAFQACNINADYLGYFAELEYHVPAIGGGAGGITRSDDVSEVWAYRGARKSIDAAAVALLGVEP